MNDCDTRRLSRAENIIIFCANNHLDHAAFPIVGEQVGKISASILLITAARAGQSPNRITKSSALDALLLDFKLIAGTARAIELKSGETGFAVPFNQVPRRIEKDIRAYADSLLTLLDDNNAPVAEGGDTPEQKTAKAALRARFLALAINPNFVAHLREDRDALNQLHTHNTTEVQEGTEDTALINEQLTFINKEVDILDPVMRNIYDRQPEKFHAWQRASRVERAPRRAKIDSPENPTPPVNPA